MREMRVITVSKRPYTQHCTVYEALWCSVGGRFCCHRLSSTPILCCLNCDSRPWPSWALSVPPQAGDRSPASSPAVASGHQQQFRAPGPGLLAPAHSLPSWVLLTCSPGLNLLCSSFSALSLEDLLGASGAGSLPPRSLPTKL